jgi:hypothetical protein
MQDSPVQPFDDPALKAALQRSLGRESAPAALRERIKGMTAAAPAPLPEPKPIPLFRKSPLYRLAVAAIVIIGFGGLGYRIWQMNHPVYDPGVVFTSALYQEMLDAHLARKTNPSGDTVTILAAATHLADSIGRPVFVADLTKDGWTFKGGAVRKVGSDQAAQLYFTKGKSAISVFSLPASVVPTARDGQSYDTVFSGAAIAGFTQGKGLFCIVETSEEGPLSSADTVKAMLEAHKGEISKG